MNKPITDDDESLVKEICADLISSRSSSNNVRARDVADDDRFKEKFDYDSKTVRSRYAGRILKNADWTERWSKLYYTVNIND